jgi:curli production assembly/transport component CsgE
MYFIANIVMAVMFAYPSDNIKDTAKVQRAPADLKKLVEEVVSRTKARTQEYLIEIDGLLVDDSKTKTGKDFYDLFYDGWQAPEKARNYTITVSEKPFRLNITQVIILINDNPVYQAILQPRQEILESLCEEAIATTQNYLTYYEEIMKQLNGEDMAGSGIF